MNRKLYASFFIKHKTMQTIDIRYSHFSKTNHSYFVNMLLDVSDSFSSSRIIMRSNRHENRVIRPTTERANCSNSVLERPSLIYFLLNTISYMTCLLRNNYFFLKHTSNKYICFHKR